MRWGPTTLGGRLTLNVFLLVSALSLVALVAVERLLIRELGNELERSTTAQLRYVEGVMRHHNRGDDGFIRAEMAEFASTTGLMVEIVDGARPLVSASQGAGRHLPATPGPAIIDGQAYHVATARHGSLQITVAAPAAGTERLHWRIQLTMAGLMAVGLAVSGLLARALGRRVTIPIAAVAEAAELVQVDRLATRLDVPVGPFDETARLTTAFNQMLSRLAGAIGRLQRFTADAAHELRTPLATMKAQLQAAGDVDGAFTTALLTEVDRLTTLVERLLVLAAVDAAPLDGERLDFTDLVVETVESARSLAEQRQVTLTIGQLDTVEAVGDRVLLRQVVANLVDNAIKYTPPHGIVTVALARGQHTSVLTVADRGVGIAPEALPFVFDRFFREDSSRTRDTGGAGLGLAIVDAVVRSHAGQVTVTSERGDGSTFVVELPVRRPGRADAPEGGDVGLGRRATG